MKLLIITQKVDINDPILGFFHNWILEFAKNVEKVSVICLEKGAFDLPENVRVYSLGKESGKSKIKYIKNFFNLILGLHKEYDAVFVHMNQEYVLLGGFIWKILRKKIYFWRNHPQGGLLTRVAVAFANKVFCTSKFAFVAKYKKTKIMPVGIDTELFKVASSQHIASRIRKILFLGRMDKIKRPDLLIEALSILDKKGTDFVCDFYGDPTPDTGDYFESLKQGVEQTNLKNKINFYRAVANYETPKIYNEHAIYVNLTPPGSFDKTILEAAACGCILVLANKSLEGELDQNMIISTNTPQAVAECIEFWLNKDQKDLEVASKRLREYVIKNHSLYVLAERLSGEICKK